MAGIYKKISGGIETYSVIADESPALGLPLMSLNIATWSADMLLVHQFRREWEKVDFISLQTVSLFDMLYPNQKGMLAMWAGTYKILEGGLTKWIETYSSIAAED